MGNRPLSVHTIASIYDWGVQSSLDGKTWLLAVAKPYAAGRVRGAWWVLTGRAFAIQWPEVGDLEAAIYERDDSND